MLTGALGFTIAGGCDKGERVGKGMGTPSATATSGGAVAATASAVATATTAAAPAKATPPPLAPGRSAPPTVQDWNAQKREVTVKGSSALNCETKMVREWLRVSCRGKNDTGGTPTNIKIVRGGREALTFSGPGVESLTMPVLEGTNFEAVFSWTDKSHPLTVKWPKGSKMPVVVGVFEGAKSPLDRSPHALDEKLCNCHKKVTKQATCDDMLGGANEDCDLTWGNDCAMLLACSRGEPGAMPGCRSGRLLGPFNTCYAICGAGKPACPSGSTCTPDFLGQPVCVDN